MIPGIERKYVGSYRMDKLTFVSVVVRVAVVVFMMTLIFRVEKIRRKKLRLRFIIIVYQQVPGVACIWLVDVNNILKGNFDKAKFRENINSSVIKR